MKFIASLLLLISSLHAQVSLRITPATPVRRGADGLPHLKDADSIALAEARPKQPRPAARATGPGVSSAGALAHMSSHPSSRTRGG